jgi:hypothetical protein
MTSLELVKGISSEVEDLTSPKLVEGISSEVRRPD